MLPPPVEKVPAGHSRHTAEPAREYVPIKHVPEQALVMPVPNVPAGQSVQVVGELTSLLVARARAYFPPLHVT